MAEINTKIARNTSVRQNGRVFSPFVSLRSGDKEIYSELSLFEYNRYCNNVNHIYRRFNAKASIEMIEMDVEGVIDLKEEVGLIKDFYKTNIYKKTRKTKDIPIKPKYITIGPVTIDSNSFSPFAIIGYGYELRVGSILGKLTKEEFKALSSASYRAETVHKDKHIIMDLSRRMQYKSIQFPVEWLKNIVPRLLLPNQVYTNDYVFEDLTKSGKDCCSSFVFNLQQTTDNAWQLLMEKIYKVYKKGSIVLYDTDTYFIDKWQLKEGNYVGVYHRTWDNTLVTTDPTSYLLEARQLQDLDRDPFPFDNLQNLTQSQIMSLCVSPKYVKSYDEALRMQYAYYSSDKGNVRRVYESFH